MAGAPLDLIDKEMWRETYNQFTDAIKTGFGDVEWGKPDWMLNQNLKYNAATFAAFKNHAESKEIQKLLTTEGTDGFKPVSWKDFRDKALLIPEKFNRRWLQTEYNHAVQSSRMARKWQDAVGDADLYPNLKYVTAGDERVRHSHKDLNGAIYPINDPFWNTYYPPNGWGCRCTVRPTDQPSKQAAGLPEIPKGFDNNPGQSGMLFTKDLAYFKGASKDEKAYLDNVVGKLVRKPEDVKKHWEKYQAYGEEWEKAGFNYDNGGYNIIHNQHNTNSLGWKFEQKTGVILKDTGYQVEFLNENLGYKIKAPDINMNNQSWDIKSVLSNTTNSIMESIWNGKKADNVIFIFADKVDLQLLNDGYARAVGRFKKLDKKIPGIYFINSANELTRLF